jgi:hypothetical protein
MFHSIPYTPREVKATEARLQAIYDAAKLGLKGDALAFAANMLPVEYRQLCQLDPVAEMAEMKGRADAEMAVSRQLHKAAEEGDAKAALAILQHVHGWTARQEISIDVYQRISITQALEDAQKRVETGRVIEHQPQQQALAQTEQNAEAAVLIR